MEHFINKLPEQATKSALEEVCKEMESGKRKLESEVSDLREIVSDMNERLRDCERYLSKDCVIIKNPPFDARQGDFFDELRNFFERYLEIKGIEKDQLKAYHIMPGTEKLPHNFMPSVIVKFVHFDNKHKVYMARRLIAKTSNPLNGKKIYINERLPPLEARLRDEVSKMGYLTSSNNCVVSIKFAKHDGRTGYAPIKHIDDCEKVRGAIKVNPWQKSKQNNGNRNVSQLNDSERIQRLYASLSPAQKKERVNFERENKC